MPVDDDDDDDDDGVGTLVVEQNRADLLKAIQFCGAAHLRFTVPYLLCIKVPR